jgi:hypothetical protein
MQVTSATDDDDTEDGDANNMPGGVVPRDSGANNMATGVAPGVMDVNMIEAMNVNMIGGLLGYPAPVWHYPNGIANIVSLHRVQQHCWVQSDSNKGQVSFHVTKSDGSVQELRPSATGLHYCNAHENETVLLDTVAAKSADYISCTTGVAQVTEGEEGYADQPPGADDTGEGMADDTGNTGNPKDDNTKDGDVKDKPGGVAPRTESLLLSCVIDSEYLITERGKLVMQLVQLQTILYGTLSVVLLLWKDQGFEPNPCDSCVMNNMVDGKQCTVLWHADNLKMSHMNVGVTEGVHDGVTEGVLDRVKIQYGDEMDDLWADVLTRPLRDTKFVKFRKLVLNLSDGGPEMNSPIDHRSVLRK